MSSLRALVSSSTTSCRISVGRPNTSLLVMQMNANETQANLFLWILYDIPNLWFLCEGRLCNTVHPFVYSQESSPLLPCPLSCYIPSLRLWWLVVQVEAWSPLGWLRYVFSASTSCDQHTFTVRIQFPWSSQRSREIPPHCMFHNTLCVLVAPWTEGPSFSSSSC